MHARRILLVLFLFCAVSLFIVFVVPVQRTFQAQLESELSPLTIYKVLSDERQWSQWYAGKDTAIPLTFDSTSKSRYLEYRIDKFSHSSRTGVIELVSKPGGESLLKWNETISFRGNLVEKLHMLFAPTKYADELVGRVSKFKIATETLSNRLGDVKLEIVDAGANTVAVKTDTVSLRSAQGEVMKTFDEAALAIQAANRAYPSQAVCRYEHYRDSMVILQSGVFVKDDLDQVKAPYALLDLPPSLKVVARVEGKLTDVKEVMVVVKDWLHQRSARTNADPWIEFTVGRDGRPSGNLQITLPFYYIK